MSAQRDYNLNNKDSDPARSFLEVTSKTHFNYSEPFPKEKFIEWLNALPEGAVVKFDDVYTGKAHFSATWKEHR